MTTFNCLTYAQSKQWLQDKQFLRNVNQMLKQLINLKSGNWNLKFNLSITFTEWFMSLGFWWQRLHKCTMISQICYGQCVNENCNTKQYV